jgi:hypothetical protein
MGRYGVVCVIALAISACTSTDSAGGTPVNSVPAATLWQEDADAGRSSAAASAVTDDPDVAAQEAGCSLQNLVFRSVAVVEGSPASDQTFSFEDELVKSLDLKISKVHAVFEGASISESQTETVSAYPTVTGTYTGSGFDWLWPDIERGEGDVGGMVMLPDAYGYTRFMPLPIRIRDDEVTFFNPPTCDLTAQFAEYGRRVGRTADLELLTDSIAEYWRYMHCLYPVSSEGLPLTSTVDGCSSPMIAIAERVGRHEPEPIEMSVEEEFWATSADQRSLRITDVPQSIADLLMLVPVHLTTIGTPLRGGYSFRCELGSGFAWLDTASPNVMPVVACRDGDLELVYIPLDENGELSAKDESVIGQLAADQLLQGSQNGLSLVLDFTSAAVGVTAALLQPGDLEKLLNLSTGELAQLRLQYTTPLDSP